MTTTTFYPAAGDGKAANEVGSSTWSTVRDNSTGNNPVYDQIYDYIADEQYATNVFQVSRLMFPIDTSAIGDGDTISDATFALTSDAFNNSMDNLGLVQTTQASPTAIVGADFGRCGALNSATEGATRVSAPNSTASTATFTLNATGIGFISKTGYTYLGVRGARDLDNSAPGVARSYCSIRMSEYTGTSSDPALTVTYSLPPASLKSWNGVAIADLKSWNGVA